MRSSNPKIIAVPADGVGIVVPLHPATARQIYDAHKDVFASVNGPMLDFCPGEPHDYATYQCGTHLSLLRDRVAGVGIEGTSNTAARGITISIRNGVAKGSRHRSPDPRALVAFQLYPGMVEDGRIAIGEKPPEDPDSRGANRVAVGILGDGRIGFAYSYASMIAFARQLQAAGFSWAGYTDGGGSSSMITRGDDGQLRGSDPDDPGGRRVGSFIVWRELSLGDRITGARLRATDFFKTPSTARTVLVVGGVVTGSAAIIGVAASIKSHGQEPA